MNEHGTIRTARTSMASRRTRVLICIVGLTAVLAASCAGSSAEPSQVATSPPAPADPPPAPAAGSVNDLPEVSVVNVASGDSVVLSSLAPADRPILAWFWAPHWPVCSREAPGVEQFARDHGDEILVIGLGTQDDLALARDFVDNTGVSSFPMFWDESFDSWAQLGVASQPAWALFSPSGEYVEGSYGGIDTAGVLATAASLWGMRPLNDPRPWVREAPAPVKSDGATPPADATRRRTRALGGRAVAMMALAALAAASCGGTESAEVSAPPPAPAATTAEQAAPPEPPPPAPEPEPPPPAAEPPPPAPEPEPPPPAAEPPPPAPEPGPPPPAAEPPPPAPEPEPPPPAAEPPPPAAEPPPPADATEATQTAAEAAQADASDEAAAVAAAEAALAEAQAAADEAAQTAAEATQEAEQARQEAAAAAPPPPEPPPPPPEPPPPPPEPPPPPPEPPPPAGPNDLPTLTVVDVFSGENVVLASFAPTDRPIFVWVWAPHWPVCRREAPGIEQFARDHGDEVLVVGLGVTDTLAEAQSFAAMTGIGSFPVVWSESFDPAALLGVFSHPSWVLLSPSGEVIERGVGGIDADGLLEKAASIWRTVAAGRPRRPG